VLDFTPGLLRCVASVTGYVAGLLRKLGSCLRGACAGKAAHNVRGPFRTEEGALMQRADLPHYAALSALAVA
jgi:hypothetical protein